MSNLEANKQVARDFFAALGCFDQATLMELLDPALVMNVENTGCMGGRYTMKEFSKAAAALGAVCPDGIRFDVLDLVAEGDRVACRVNGYGKVATGGEYNNRYHFQLVIRGGKIVETFEYMDTLLVEQIFGPVVAAAQ